MLQKIKEQSNLEAKLGALKEMISEGWLTHIQQHPTLLKPNWPFRDQIASEDGIFTKAHRIIIPTTLQKYIFAKLHRPHKVTRRIKLRARTSTGDGRLVPWHRRYHKSMQYLWGTPVQSTKATPNTHRDTHRAWHTVEADLFTLDTTLRSYALTTRTDASEPTYERQIRTWK